MLLKKSWNGKGHSQFVCDRCGKKITIKNRYAIYVKNDKLSHKKEFDLCDKCYVALKKGIRKGISRKETSVNEKRGSSV